jgi:hypothetical protein
MMRPEFEEFKKEKREQLWSCPNGRYPVQAGYIVAGFGRHRDSDALARANFDTAARLLCQESHQEDLEWDGLDTFSSNGDEIYTADVIIGSWGHWAVGWVEELLIREDAQDVVGKAYELVAYVRDEYPVLDDDLMAMYELEEADE